MKLTLTLILTATSLMAAEPAAPLWDERVPLLKAADLPVLGRAEQRREQHRGESVQVHAATLYVRVRRDKRTPICGASTARCGPARMATRRDHDLAEVVLGGCQSVRSG